LKLKYKNFPAFNIDAKRPLFVVVSGAHAYGSARPDSDLDVRGVRIPALDWALSLARDESGVEHRFGNVDVSVHNVYHFLSVLLHGNGTFLENMFEERLYTEEPAFTELRDLVMKHGVTKRFADHYYGLVRSCLRDYNQKKRIKYVLNGYRVAMAGIRLFLTGEVMYNLNDLLKSYSWKAIIDSFDETNFADLLTKYKAESDLIMPNEYPMPYLLETLTEMQKLFDKESSLILGKHTYSRCTFPDEPNYAPFNEWLARQLLSDYFNLPEARSVKVWKKE